MKFVFSPAYEVDIGEHPFLMQKFRRVRERLIQERIAAAADFIEPGPASPSDVELVHTSDYVEGIHDGTLSLPELLRLELPYSPELAHASFVGVGGTILACRLALESAGAHGGGMAYHIGGGFHHSYPDHGEGFCVFNDIAVGIRKMQEEGRIKKAAVIDCDVHQGNGTAVCFQDDPDVFTFSIHQEDNYPMPKERSTLDVGLWGGDGDAPFLKALREHIPRLLSSHRPELLLYVAGADPYEHDKLGQLQITMEGLAERDRIVLSEAHRLKIPTAIVLAGGYAENPDDLVTIHFQTAKIAAEIFSKQFRKA